MHALADVYQPLRETPLKIDFGRLKRPMKNTTENANSIFTLYCICCRFFELALLFIFP